MRPPSTGTLKRWVERGILLSGVPSAFRRASAGRALVLAYHDVVPNGEAASGEASLHISQREFANHLDRIERRCSVVPLHEALDPSRGGDRPRVAITFDDAYSGAITAGIDELRRRGMPATIFVAPAFVGSRTFWWDVLADSRGVLSPLHRAHALAHCSGSDDLVRQWATSAGVPQREPGPSARCATEDELRAAAKVPGIELGSHTWSHPNLARLDEDEIRLELRRSAHWLDQRFTRWSRVVSLPYGLASPSVERAVAQEGFEGLLRIDGGWLPPGASRPFVVPRLNVPAGLSPDGLLLRCSMFTAA